MLDQLTEKGTSVRRAFGVFDDGECFGAAVLEWETGHNVHLGNVEIFVPPEHRQKGVGTALMKRVIRESDDQGLTTLMAEVNAVSADSAGPRFANDAGFITVHTEDNQVLDLPVPLERLEELEAVSDAPRLGYTSQSWLNETPAERVSQMATLQTGMNTDVPTGNMDFDPAVLTVEDFVADEARVTRQGYITLTTLAMAPTGVPAGYTRIYIHKDDKNHALQDATWAHSDHRGLRMGAWLKAENIAFAQSVVPEALYIHTSNAQNNAGIQSLNSRFGFRPTDVLHWMQRGSRY